MSVYPLLMYRAWGDAAVVSQWYFGIGILSLLTALSVPALVRRIPRRWVYAMGVGFYLLAAVFGVWGGSSGVDGRRYRVAGSCPGGAPTTWNETTAVCCSP